MTKTNYTSFSVPEGTKEVNMVFGHDTELALNAAAALVNTEQADVDELADVPALDRFVATWGWTTWSPPLTACCVRGAPSRSW
jgi:hypothetical protein